VIPYDGITGDCRSGHLGRRGRPARHGGGRHRCSARSSARSRARPSTPIRRRASRPPTSTKTGLSTSSPPRRPDCVSTVEPARRSPRAEPHPAPSATALSRIVVGDLDADGSTDDLLVRGS
jgi:hypothetical protein